LPSGAFFAREGAYAEKSAPPTEVQEYFGWDCPDPILIVKSRETAAVCNDELGWSFKRIATAFERYSARIVKRLEAAK
jgi:hypothetical protein